MNYVLKQFPALNIFLGTCLTRFHFIPLLKYQELITSVKWNYDWSRHINGSPYPSHFIFEIKLYYIGESRTRRRTILNFEWRHLQSILKDHSIQIRCSCMSDPRLSDINFDNKMAWVWTTFKWDFRLSSIGKNGVQNANCHWGVNSWSQRSSEEVEKF